MRNFLRSLLAFGLAALIAACGRGSGGDNTASAAPPEVASTADNVQAISVNAGPANTVNFAFTSVTVCIPGTSQCRTIDNVIIDTGSTGLRILSSALAGLSLPQQQLVAGHSLAECEPFLDGSYMWGPVHMADVKIGGKIAQSTNVHIVAENSVGTAPATCLNNSNPLATPFEITDALTLGGNAILGVGQFREDCGTGSGSGNPDDIGCLNPQNDFYYDCSASAGCVETAADASRQVQNPVARFASDNNGVIVNLPAISESGSVRVDGQMIFGIGTRDNNTLGNALVHTVDGAGYLTTSYKGEDFPQSFVDSGSNGLYFPDDNIPSCFYASGFYCPTSTLQLTATITGIKPNNASSSVAFSVANAESLNFNFSAFKNLAGPSDPYSSGFDWGLPFFFGRKVYTAFETNPEGPYIAF